MPTQNVNLTATLDAFVKQQVSQGHFNNASEVHRAALTAMLRQEEERQLRMERLRREIQLGIDDAETGRMVKISSPEHLGTMFDGCLDQAIHQFKHQKAEPRA